MPTIITNMPQQVVVSEKNDSTKREKEIENTEEFIKYLKKDLSCFDSLIETMSVLAIDIIKSRENRSL